MRNKNLYRLFSGGLVLFLLLHSTPVLSFMYVDKDDALPHLEFVEHATGSKKEFDVHRKRPLIMIFWGADIDTKKERAIQVLGAIQKNISFYRQRDIELAAVLAQPEQISDIDDVVAQTHLDFPVYVDSQSQSFEKLGLSVMPSILIVDKAGVIYGELGYSKNLDVLLPGEMQVMLHEESREELSAELNPEIIERTTPERRARLEYNYALNLIQRHRIDAALAKLDLALGDNPQFAPALVEKGCLLIKKKKFKEAGEFLDQGLGLLPESERALICKADLKNAEEKVEDVTEVPVKSTAASWGFFATDDEDDDEMEDGESSE